MVPELKIPRNGEWAWATHTHIDTTHTLSHTHMTHTRSLTLCRYGQPDLVQPYWCSAFMVLHNVGLTYVASVMTSVLQVIDVRLE